jgi:hypothetical protein
MINKPTKRQLEYWDKILHYNKLGEGRGRSSLVDYRGGAKDMDIEQTKQIVKKSGRTKPKQGAE